MKSNTTERHEKPAETTEKAHKLAFKPFPLRFPLSSLCNEGGGRKNTDMPPPKARPRLSTTTTAAPTPPVKIEHAAAADDTEREDTSSTEEDTVDDEEAGANKAGAFPPSLTIFEFSPPH